MRSTLATGVAAAAVAAAPLVCAVPLAAHQPGGGEGTPAEVPDQESALEGTWEGTLELPQTGAELRLVFHIDAGEEGALTGTMDSPDQGATGIPVTGIDVRGDTVRLEVASVQGAYEGRLAAPDTLRGEWRQPAGAFPLELHRVDAAGAAGDTAADTAGGTSAAARARPQEPEPPFPYETEEVRFENEAAGIELAGTLTLPRGAGPFPAAVLLTGSGPQDRDETVFGHRPFLVLADHLTRAGIAVLRYDDRGVGASGGAFEGATVEDFAGDALAAVDHLASRPEIDGDAVGFVGHSEGGLTAPLAETRSEDVDYLVLLAAPGVSGAEILGLQMEAIMRANGATDAQIAEAREAQDSVLAVVVDEPDPEEREERLRALLREQAGADASAEGDAAPRDPADAAAETADRRVEAQARQMASPWFRHFLLHDPRPVLAEVDEPVLALWGGLDLQVPPAENLPAVEGALERGGSPDVTVRELPGLNHLFQHAETGSPSEYGRIEETFAPEAMEAIADWILERFGATG